MEKIKINIVVPTYKNKEKLINTVVSILSSTKPYDTLVYVIDNNIPAGLKPVANYLFCNEINVKVYTGDVNGPCQARNKAIQMMRPADFVFFLDDDIVVTNDYFSKAILSFKELDSADIITFNSFICNSKIKRLIRFILIKILFYGKIIDPRGILNYATTCNVVSGGNFAIRGRVVSSVLWDESYYGYSFAEDIDFGIRASKILNIYYNPNINLVHDSILKNDKISDILRKYLGYSYVIKKNFKNSNYILFNIWAYFLLKSIIRLNINVVMKLGLYYGPKVLSAKNHKKIIEMYLNIK